MLSQKGNGLIIGILIGLLIVGALGAAYYLGSSKTAPSEMLSMSPPPVLNAPPPQIVPNTVPNPSSVTSPEINGFPVYPNAQFVETANIPPCADSQSRPTPCNATAYSWKVNVNFSQLTTFFSQDKSNSGWKCSGGGGGGYTDDSNASTMTRCNKGDLVYYLNIITKNGFSEYSLIIPKDSPSSN